MTEGSRWDSASSELWGLVPESDFKGAQSSLWRQGLLTGIFEQGQDFQSFLLSASLESDDELKDFLVFRMQAYFNERLRFYILWNLKLSPKDRLQLGTILSSKTNLLSLLVARVYYYLGSLNRARTSGALFFRCLIGVGCKTWRISWLSQLYYFNEIRIEILHPLK